MMVCLPHIKRHIYGKTFIAIVTMLIELTYNYIIMIIIITQITLGVKGMVD